MDSLPAPTVLVVDDDHAIRHLVAEVLRGEGYRVVEAEHGAAALVRVADAPPELIILDMRMPVLDGWGFVREYRSLPGEHAPIVVMTAANDAGVWAAEVQADDCVDKPFDVEHLLSVVSRFCPPESVSA